MLPFPRLTLPLLIAAALAGNPVAWAETPPAPATVAPEQAPAEEMSGEEMPPAEEEVAGEPLFGLEYKIGADQPKTVDVLDNDPFGPLLEIVKQTADLASKSKIKPARLTTLVKILLPEDVTEDLGELPPLKMNTTVQSDGSGKSVFDMAVYNKQISKPGEEGSIAWQGLSGEVSYQDPQLTSPAGQVRFPGLHIKVDAEKVDFQFKDLRLGAALDADWMPRKLEFSLPELTLNSPDGDMALNKLAFHGEVQEARPGLDLGTGGLTLDNFSFKQGEEAEARIQGFRLAGDGKLDGEVIHYILDLDMNKLFLSGEFNPSGSKEFSYDSTLELRNIDAAATAELQKSVRELQKQQREGSISEDMLGIVMIGTMMQNLPKFWQKSPEFAASKINLKTEHGDISGHFNVKVDGTQKLDLENEEVMKNAISGAADFTIAKGILTTLFDMQIRESLDEMAAHPAPEPEAAQPAQPGQAPQAGQAAPAQPPAPPTEADIAQMVEAQIQALVAQKWLAPEGADKFKFSAQWQQGKLIVNGQPMELPM